MKAIHREGPAGNRASSSSQHLVGCGANATEPVADPPGPGVDLLLANLNVTSGGHGHWKAVCPCCKSQHGHLHIDVRADVNRASVRVHCKRCGANGDAVIEALGLTSQRGHIYYGGNGVYL